MKRACHDRMADIPLPDTAWPSGPRGQTSNRDDIKGQSGHSGFKAKLVTQRTDKPVERVIAGIGFCPKAVEVRADDK